MGQTFVDFHPGCFLAIFPNKSKHPNANLRTVILWNFLLVGQKWLQRYAGCLDKQNWVGVWQKRLISWIFCSPTNFIYIYIIETYIDLEWYITRFRGYYFRTHLLAPWMLFLGLVLLDQLDGHKANLRGCAIDWDLNPRAFDLMSPAGFAFLS